ncbi:MAG TPA: EamA family transporter [Actinomycetes bacterium]|nr:EamA family transporter [Actinomycetes bacterium]
MTRRGWVLFLGLGVIWGVPYLLIKVAVAEVSPVTLVLARTAVGALVLIPLAARRGLLGPVLARWKPLLAFTLAEICVPWWFLSEAERHLSSSLAGLLVAAVPLVGAVLVQLTGQERLDRRRAVGLVAGLGGVAALVGFDVHTDDLAAVAAVGIVVIGYAIGPIILARYLSDLPALGVMAAALVLASILIGPFGVAAMPTSWPSQQALLALLVLGVVCTATAFLMFHGLIAEVGAARATVVAYVNPAVAVVLGVVVLGERFTWATALGFGLILIGSVLATAAGRAKAAPAPEPSAVTANQPVG